MRWAWQGRNHIPTGIMIINFMLKICSNHITNCKKFHGFYQPLDSQDRIKLNTQLIAVFGKTADMSLIPTSREFPVATEYVVDEYVISHRKMPALMAKVAEIIYI
jgi:hypothetical protein